MISVILLVSFIITSSDTAFALAPSSKVLDESFKNEFALRFQDEIVHRTIGEAFLLKMSVSGVRDMVDRCVGKSVSIIIDSVEDDAIFYSFRNYKGEVTSFGCFRSAVEVAPTGAVWIKKIGDRVYWAQEIRPTERSPVEKIASKSSGEIAEEKNKDGDENKDGDVLIRGTQPSVASPVSSPVNQKYGEGNGSESLLVMPAEIYPAVSKFDATSIKTPSNIVALHDSPKRAIPHILQAIKDGDVDGDIREAETIICPWDKNISIVKVKYFTDRGRLYYEFDGAFDLSRPAGKELTHQKIFHLTRHNQGLVFDGINRRIVFHVEGPEGVSFDHPVTALSSIIGIASISLTATGALAALQEVLPEKQSIGNVDKFIGPHIIPVSICLGAGIIIAIILKIIFNKIRSKRIEWMLQEERFEQGRDYVTRVYYKLRSRHRVEEVKDTFSGRNIIELIKNSDHKKAVMGFNLLSHANQEFKDAIVSALKEYATGHLGNNNFDGLMLFGEASEELKNEILMALNESGVAFIINAAKIELEAYAKETEKRTMKNKTLSVLCDGSVRIGFGEELEKSPYEIEYSNIPKEAGEEKEGQLLVLDKQDPDNIRSVGRYRLPLGVTCIISGKGDEGWVDKDTYRIILDQSWFFDGINLSIKMSEDSGKYRAELTDLGSSLFLIRKKDGANWSASDKLTGLNFTANAYYYRLAKQKQAAQDVGKKGKPRLRIRARAGKNVAGPESVTSVEASPAARDLSSEALPKVSKALEEAWAEFRSTNAVDLEALGKKHGLTDGELEHIAITVQPGQGAGSGESASGAAQDDSDVVSHKLPRVTRPAFVDLRSMPHDSHRDVWKTGLYDIGTLKKMIKAVFEAEKVTMDDWRYKVSLFALTDKEIDGLIAYLRRLKVRKDNDAYYQLRDVRGDLVQYIARIRADGNVLIHLGAPVYQFCAELLPSIEELNRSIYNDGNPPQNHDYAFAALKGEYRSQLKEIRKYGGEIGLAVHGVRDWKWRDPIGQNRDLDIDIPDGKIRFLNVLLEGNIRSFRMPLVFSNLKMDVGYLDTKHDTSFSDNGDAGTFGPSFIILDRNWEYDAKGDIGENHHKYYLVPNAEMKKFLINGIEKSVEAGLIDSVGADVRKGKIVTYGEYLDILSGKNVAPAALDNHFEPRDGGMDVPYEEKGIDANLVYSTETVGSFPAEFRSVDSARFIGLYEKETGKKAAGEALRFASILGRLNIAARQIYLTLTENGDRLYPSGCGPISSAVCQLLTDNGFEAFVRSNSGNDHFVATVRFVSEDKFYYFIIDYTADQFLKPLERKRTVISPVIIPFTGVSSIARPLRDFYESDEKNDYKPLVIDDVDDPAFVAYKTLKQEFDNSGSGNSGAIPERGTTQNQTEPTSARMSLDGAAPNEPSPTSLSPDSAKKEPQLGNVLPELRKDTGVAEASSGPVDFRSELLRLGVTSPFAPLENSLETAFRDALGTVSSNEVSAQKLEKALNDNAGAIFRALGELKNNLSLGSDDPQEGMCHQACQYFRNVFAGMFSGHEVHIVEGEYRPEYKYDDDPTHYWIEIDGKITLDITYGQFDPKYRNKVLVIDGPHFKSMKKKAEASGAVRSDASLVSRAEIAAFIRDMDTQGAKTVPIACVDGSVFNMDMEVFRLAAPAQIAIVSRREAGGLKWYEGSLIDEAKKRMKESGSSEEDDGPTQNDTSPLQPVDNTVEGQVFRAEECANMLKIFTNQIKREYLAGRRESQKIVIGIETEGWMTDAQRDDLKQEDVIHKIQQVVNKMQTKGIIDKDTVRIVYGDSEHLAVNVAAAQSEIGAPMINTAVLGSEKTLIASGKFDEFKDKAFLACVDPGEMERMSYLRIFEMLTIVAKLALGREAWDAVRSEHPDIAIEKIGEFIARLIPSEKAFAPDEPRKVYELQVRKFEDQA